MAAPPAPARAAIGARLLDRVERLGNALPHPAVLFAALAVLVVVLSAVAAGSTSRSPTPRRAPRSGP